MTFLAVWSIATLMKTGGLVTNFFIDTSALNKRYLAHEAGSVWLRALTAPAARNRIVISDLTAVECYSTFARLYREAKITSAQHRRFRRRLLRHTRRNYFVISINERTLSVARRMVNRHPLRALDAIQLASALVAVNLLPDPITFVTSDKRLYLAAAAEGFIVDDPNHHP